MRDVRSSAAGEIHRLREIQEHRHMQTQLIDTDMILLPRRIVYGLKQVVNYVYDWAMALPANQPVVHAA